MQKISRENLRKLIQQEVNKIGEDVLVHKRDVQGTPPLTPAHDVSPSMHTAAPCEGECGSCSKCNGSSHKEGAYMAKSQLYKIANYAVKLYEMIPQDHDLEDWKRTKISQMADDIGEVYHSLDHKIFKGDL
tara:strand:- start:1166 stop:1558 length:393 start_codon:yes stop_codon:yes gene_type:complete